MSIFSTKGAGSQTHNLVRWAATVFTSGMLIVGLLMMFSGPPSTFPAIGVGLTSFLIYTASLAVGGFLGFLFGLPRSRAVEQVTSGQQGPNQTSTASHFLANSNLIKVSDWLTTIIIGLTLVNLGEVVPAMTQLGNALRKPLGDYDYSSAIGLGIMVGSLVGGFLLAYLWTSIRARELLEEAERRATRGVLADLKGLTVDQAKDVGTHFGFHLVFPAGAQGAAIVASHDPAPGSVVEPGATIKVSVA